jgi:glutamate synthase domain-containing protein 3
MCNLDSIDLAGVTEDSEGERELLTLLREHVSRTASPLAARILADWPSFRPNFVQVMPIRK